MHRSAWFFGWPIAAIVWLGIGNLECNGQTGDPRGERNQASKGLLPQGPGLAAGLAAGARIDQHTDVIFAEDFESDDSISGWDDIRNDRGRVLSIARLEAGEAEGSGSAVSRHGRSLKVTSTLGENTGGGLTKWFESGDRKTLPGPFLGLRFWGGHRELGLAVLPCGNFDSDLAIA